jgi:hypothetical protein
LLRVAAIDWHGTPLTQKEESDPAKGRRKRLMGSKSPDRPRGSVKSRSSLSIKDGGWLSMNLQAVPGFPAPQGLPPVLRSSESFPFLQTAKVKSALKPFVIVAGRVRDARQCRHCRIRLETWL